MLPNEACELVQLVELGGARASWDSIGCSPGRPGCLDRPLRDVLLDFAGFER